MTVWLVVALTALRELLRALLAPFRLVCYLPQRRHWRRVADEALQAPAMPAGDEAAAVVEKLLARSRSGAGGRPHLFVSAGEQSGEDHAVRLLQALRGERIDWSCFGGQPLAAAGARLLFPLSEHAVMGLIGVLKQLPFLLRAHAAFLRLLRDRPPDLVVLVDYPGLHMVMAKAARRAGVPVLHFVAPQYWAWGPWRMRRYRRSVDATLTILPFETAFFRRFGVPAHYIGHPLLDQLASAPAAGQVDAVRSRPTLCLLPGSRRADIAANLPGMIQVATALRAEVPGLRVVLPHRDPRRSAFVRQCLAGAGAGAGFVEQHEGELSPWLAGARLVLAKSGTGSLEACLYGNPVVVVYQLRSLMATLGYHNILSVPFIAAANLIAGRQVVPEFCFQRRQGWSRVLTAVRELWFDDDRRRRCRDDLALVRARLGEGGATARAAAIVARFVTERARQR